MSKSSRHSPFNEEDEEEEIMFRAEIQPFMISSPNEEEEQVEEGQIVDLFCSSNDNQTISLLNRGCFNSSPETDDDEGNSSDIDYSIDPHELHEYITVVIENYINWIVESQNHQQQAQQQAELVYDDGADDENMTNINSLNNNNTNGNSVIIIEPIDLTTLLIDQDEYEP